MALETPLMCSTGGYADPDSRPDPRPPAPLGYSGPITTLPPVTPDLDLSLTPDRLGRATGILKRDRERGRPAHRQVRFDINPMSKDTEADPSPSVPGGLTVVTVSAPAPRRAVKHKDPKGRRSWNGPVCDGLQAAAGMPMSSAGGVLTEGPQLNTVLALGAELRGMTEAEFDPERAVLQRLRESTQSRNNIESRATEALNIPRSQQLFHALVSVRVSEDQLLSAAAKERLLPPPPPRCQGTKDAAEGPDLLTFYNPCELLRETPCLPGDGLTLPRPRALPRPAHATFDLYHRHRQWEA
ncbi:protein phosphatase 1 regulatory subunit 35 [Amia ocellicauda]|uniref:protein phosphatase 1 regulatory subunit 35 n=1 Tax=Amia ocellicauda TaxID=2972642 RepID=UPI0034644FF0